MLHDNISKLKRGVVKNIESFIIELELTVYSPYNAFVITLWSWKNKFWLTTMRQIDCNTR